MTDNLGKFLETVASNQKANLARARGYFVSTVGRDTEVIREYIKKQEEEDKRLEQMNLWR
jgi:REP element-mobilizing transposase RayT